MIGACVATPRCHRKQIRVGYRFAGDKEVNDDDCPEHGIWLTELEPTGVRDGDGAVHRVSPSQRHLVPGLDPTQG